MKTEKDYENVIAHVNRVIDNLNQHWHSIQLLLGHISKPLLVDDRGLHHVLLNIKQNLQDTFSKVDSLIEEMKNLDISQTFSEIKYIGKRLNEIEITLKKMQSEGIKKNIELEFRCDGYEMVKKPLNYDKKEPIEDPDQDLTNLLETLDQREVFVLIHRFGLLGRPRTTLKQIGKLIGISSERVRAIEVKALRKLRHPSRKSLAQKIKHALLKKSIFGEELE